MTTLGELPWLHLRSAADCTGPFAEPLPHGGVQADKPDALKTALAGLDSEWLVLVDPDVTESSEAGAFPLDPVLLRAGLCLGFLSFNAVNADVSQSLRVCRRDLVLRLGALPVPDLVYPKIAGTWHPNRTPEACFRAAFEAMPAREEWPSETAERQRLALSASLGADVDDGSWWMLGALLSLLGRADVDASWRAERRLLLDTEDLARRTREVARVLRVSHGLPVRPLAPMQSKLVKQLAPQWPPARFWHEFADGCDKLGPDGQRLAAAYRHAGNLLWAEAIESPDSAADVSR